MTHAVQPGAWYAISVLTVVYTFSFIDRSILSLLVGPIRDHLQITDTQFSLLHGLAFAIFYTVLGIPIGRMADRYNRRNIIAVGVFVWSLATAGCGFARNFIQLFLARVWVGVGEAALSPSAYSLIADMFPREKLGRALGIYSSGVYFGLGLAFLIGGNAIEWISKQAWVTNTGFAPWQLTFMIVGFPGIALAFIVLTMREPLRRGADGNAIEARAIPLRKVFAFIKHFRDVYLLHFISFASLTLVFYAIMSWAPEYFIRIHGMERAKVGTLMGFIVLIFGSAGIASGGWVSDWLSRRGHVDAPLRAGLIGAVAVTPLAALAPTVANVTHSMILFCPLLFFLSFPFSPAAAALQIMTPNSMRAQISAVYLFIVNLSGIGFGGTAAALLTDYVFKDDQKLHLSMAAVGTAGAIMASIFLVLAATRYRKRHEEMSRYIVTEN